MKAAAFVLAGAILVLTAFTCTQPIKANASANLTAYVSVPPTDWEPEGYNTTGTAPWYVVQTLGWTPTRMMGNVGIGDGSVSTLNRSSNQDVNYTANNFMAADISMAPWDPARITSPGGAAVAGGTVTAPETAGNNTPAASANNSTTGHSISMPDISNLNLTNPEKLSFDNNTTSAPVNPGETAATSTVIGTGGVTFNGAQGDPYHTITMGRPVDDLLYEYPLATSITMYGRLVGLPMPDGCGANIGIRCLGYGY